MHGPTFMANTLACSVAWPRSSYCSAGMAGTCSPVEAGLRDGLEAARSLPAVADVRVLGAIGVIEVAKPIDVRVTTMSGLPTASAAPVPQPRLRHAAVHLHADGSRRSPPRWSASRVRSGKSADQRLTAAL